MLTALRMARSGFALRLTIRDRTEWHTMFTEGDGIGRSVYVQALKRRRWRRPVRYQIVRNVAYPRQKYTPARLRRTDESAKALKPPPPSRCRLTVNVTFAHHWVPAEWTAHQPAGVRPVVCMVLMLAGPMPPC